MTVKKASLVINVIIAFAIVLIVVLFFFLSRRNNELSAATSNRFYTTLLVDELRKSSEELTHEVQMYAATGAESAETAYNKALAVRSGHEPRPVNAYVAPGEKRVLLDLLKEHGITDAECSLVEKANALSDDLVALEVESMNAVKGIFKDSSGEYTIHADPDRELALSLVFCDSYFEEVRKIMAPIDEFQDLVYNRTAQSMREAQAQQKTTERIAIIATVLIFLVGSYAFAGNARNLREIKTIMENTREADERTNAMFNAMPLCANYWSRDHKIIDCNDEVVRLLELANRQEYIDRFGELSPEFQPDGSHSVETAAMLVTKAFEEGYCHFEWTMQKLNGEPIPTDVVLIRIEYRNDYHVFAYFRDLREQKQLLKKYDQQAQLLDTVNTAATILLANNDANVFESLILKCFDLIGRCLNVDRVQIWRNETINEELNFVLRYEWLSDFGKTCKPIPYGLHFPYSQKKEWEQKFRQHQYINSPLSQLSEEDQEFLKFYEMKSIVIIPMFLENVFWGFFSIDDCRSERAFSKEEINILTSAGLMISSAIDRSIQTIKIRDADERAQIIFDTSPIGSLMFDHDFNIFDCNQETVRIFGLSDKSVFLERFFELSPEYQPCGRKSSDMMMEYNNKVFDEGYHRFEWMHQSLSGEPIPCENTLVRVKYKDKYTVAGFVRDLREQKALLEEIHQDNERFKNLAHYYEAILDTIPFPLSITDADMNWTFINKATENYLEIKREDVIGLPCDNWRAEICHTDRCGIHRLKRGFKQTYFKQKGASFQVDGDILIGINGETEGFIEVVQDITQLELTMKQQAEAKAASSAKSSFLSTMSHEIRTPMNAVIGMTEIGLSAADIERKNYALNRIKGASRHLLGVINDILDMSKIEANKLELSPVSFNLHHSLEKAVSLIQFVMEEKQINFFIDVSDDTPSCLIGDDQRLTQVIMNLLSNAVKFTPKNGNIKLTVSFLGEENGICELCIEVADSGIGISPEQQEKIFHPFEQAENDTTRKFGGTGLGLVITKRIIELMNGLIWVESEIGNGSRFIFTVKLPRDENGSLVQQNSEDEEKITIDEIRTKSKNKNLLIVEDIEINREILISLLEGTEMIIDTAENGKEALDMVTAAPDKYDLIFMDMQMPVMDGVKATRQIRALPSVRDRKLPIIAMTANVFQEDIEKCNAAGMDDHIGKPLELVKVLEKLRDYL